jgi:hypothetical protein
MLGLHVGEISSPGLQATNVVVRYRLSDAGALDLHIDRLALQRRIWRDVSLSCPKTVISDQGVINCPRGTLADTAASTAVSFSLDAAHRKMNVSLQPGKDELWQAQALMQSGRWQTTLEVAGGRASRLPADIGLPVVLSGGLLNGQAALNGNADGLQHAEGRLQMNDVAFADAAGLHAGAKVAAYADFNLQRDGDRWNWRLNGKWIAGEVFWQPLYFAKGGVTLQAAGWLDDSQVVLDEGSLGIAEVGEALLSGKLRRAGNEIDALDFKARNLDVAGAYGLLLKPFLEKTLLGNLDVAGRADAQAQLREGRLQTFDVALRDFDVEDKNGRFAFYKVNADLPWAADRATQAALQFAGGKLLQLPLGASALKAKLDGYSLTAPKLQVPLLDGVLTVQDVSAARIADLWHWHLRADLSPVGLPEFSHAMGWPHMDGKISAAIPLVTYSGGQLTTDGAMQFRAFDGVVKVSNLALRDPLGLAPRLTADLEMRNLDMAMLTRTFSFGAMTGWLDGDVNNLELSSWQPARFDASFRSSPGSYPKKISQRAVENISALGGAGAAAAIQRSFLRFFKEFNYSRIGLSCKLRNGICQMDGVEPAQSGYVIVKGSGVPAITVLGYNRSVSWGELLERVQRITQGNKPVIK